MNEQVSILKKKTRMICNNSSRCSIFGNTGKIDSPSDSDEFGEEVIYSHESPKMDEIIKDFDWESSRFVEYRSPFTRKETLPLVGNNSSHRNIHNSLVIDNQRNEIKKSKLKHQFRFRVGNEFVIDLELES
jgi:hypothetical protein